MPVHGQHGRHSCMSSQCVKLLVGTRKVICKPHVLCSSARKNEQRVHRVQAVDKALQLRTPHSGYHDDGTDRRFFEGWYFKVVLPDIAKSFALIYSIEKNGPKDGKGRIGAQVMGPDDGYIAHTNTNPSSFWAGRNDLSLGACFKPAAAMKHGQMPKQMVGEDAFNDMIEHGFQASDSWHQGCIEDAPGTAAGSLPASVPVAEWAFRVRPIYGWGDSGKPQKSTAGWLSALPVFEPHWQVLMAHGVADGYLRWGDQKLTFSNCPMYAEKNWGAGFPRKWGWIQCNSFDSHPHLSVTAVGAVRSVLNVPGIDENVGMIGIHYEGRFIELVPWAGDMRWSIEPWGKWHMWAKNGTHEALIEADCDAADGCLLRAPLADEGLAPACKDTFNGRARLRVWELDMTGVRKGAPIIDATSSTAALEVGGGPWWHTWKEEAKMNRAVAMAINAPVDAPLGTLESLVPFKLPTSFLPPGM